MANHQSAKKRALQTVTCTARNKSTLSRMRNLVKKVEEQIKAKDATKATELFNMAQSVVMKTAQKGIIHKNNAGRKLSRLVSRIKKI
ncbi:MAG: 30S ribosomal protein S20 [Alphaproteobacteria bacterium]